MLRHGLAALLLTGMVVVAGCSAHTHVVGAGAQEWTGRSEKQWHLIGGLITLNEVDTATMAAGLVDYEITTEETFVDGLIGVFTGRLVTARTVTVTK
jgi:hypothetical protein